MVHNFTVFFLITLINWPWMLRPTWISSLACCHQFSHWLIYCDTLKLHKIFQVSGILIEGWTPFFQMLFICCLDDGGLAIDLGQYGDCEGHSLCTTSISYSSNHSVTPCQFHGRKKNIFSVSKSFLRKPTKTSGFSNCTSTRNTKAKPGQRCMTWHINKYLCKASIT